MCLIYSFDYKWTSTGMLDAKVTMQSKTRHSPCCHTTSVPMGDNLMILVMGV